jgi:hypothetical protein
MTDPLMRLADFRRHHPAVVIGRAEFRGGWDAKVPLPCDGRGYFAPRPLGDLLDALEEELDEPP